MAEGRVLVVDDDSLIRKSLYESLKLEGYYVETASDAVEAEEKLKEFSYDVALVDMKMPQIDGIQLLRIIREKYPGTATILITGYGSIETAVEAMKLGAADYVTKPVVDDEVKLIIQRVVEQKKLREENRYLREKLTGRYQFHNIVGQDRYMQEIYSMIETIADTDATILIRGESGTGKRLIAHAIHYNDLRRKDKPFVEVSCGALPETLLESELFGHVRGAFTSAIRDKMGRFKLADKGTIFLDDIGTLNLNLQVKLLRVLQEQEFEQVGGTSTIKVDVRVIAATNRNLEEDIKNNCFREDLYYRLNVVSIALPPLRERVGDIPILAQHFLNKFSQQVGRKQIERISDAAMDRLVRYNWPGNVRELENAMERAIILCKGDIIQPDDLPEAVREMQVSFAGQRSSGVQSLKDALKSPERDVILQVLEETGWNRKETANILKINRTTLYNKMKEYRLEKPKTIDFKI